MTKNSAPTQPRIGVLVVAFNAATTLRSVLDRLPPTFRSCVEHVLVNDDASGDDTFDVGLEYQRRGDLPMSIFRHAENLGYGGNQKHGYRWAIDHGLDIVVLLHGDGQYAPEVIEDIVAPIADGRADAVFGSRMLARGAARAGGMPMYKWLGNRILTRLQNAVTGAQLSEWHSGYRAYRVDTLAGLPLETYSDGFDFDTEIILGLLDAHATIGEVPIPTYYGDESCDVNGVRYAKDIMVDVVRHRVQQMGLGRATAPLDVYELKLTPHSSHGRLLSWLSSRPPSRVLDVGCSDGRFGALAQEQGHSVTGVDIAKHEGVADRLDAFVEADLDVGLPVEAGTEYDIVIAADVIEHTVEPTDVLRALADRLRPDGSLFVSVPNFAHWYPRTRVALGRFDYDSRGILDRGHLRFFTRRSLERVIADAGMRIVRRDVVGSPIELLDDSRSGAIRILTRLGGVVDRAAVRFWPTLFGYQFLYELRRY
ncbi:hypothetical protein BH24ACT5_BH24ACT5_03700 [soil metagenome]